MVKFLKIVWILSVFVIVVFNIAFDGYRILDFITGNHTVKTMKISDNSYETTSRRKSITIFGHVGSEKVYFSRFDDEIGKLYALYPEITSNELSANEDNKIISFALLDVNLDNSKHIEVIKFKHSQIVMLTKDNEFQRWKNSLYLFAIYSMVSIIILIFMKKSSSSKFVEI